MTRKPLKLLGRVSHAVASNRRAYHQKVRPTGTPEMSRAPRKPPNRPTNSSLIASLAVLHTAVSTGWKHG